MQSEVGSPILVEIHLRVEGLRGATATALQKSDYFVMNNLLPKAFSQEEIAQISKRFLAINKRKEITKAQFQHSLGIIGLDHATFILDRLFNIITTSATITLEQYINYLQIAMLGNDQQKSLISFKFLDINRNGFVEYKDFQQMMVDLVLFWNQLTGCRATPKQSFIRNLWDQFEADKLTFEIYQAKFEYIQETVDWFEFFNQQIDEAPPQSHKLQEDRVRRDLVRSLIDTTQAEMRNCVNLLSEYEKSKVPDDSVVQGPCNFSTSQIAKDGDEDPSFEISFLSHIPSDSFSYQINHQESYLDQMGQRIEHLIQMVEQTVNYSPTSQTVLFRTPQRQSICRRRATIKLLPAAKVSQSLSVHFGHENWNLILNLMLGLRKAVFSIQPLFYGAKVLRSEFSDTYLHEILSSRSTNFDSKKAYLIKDYAPSIFLRIRRKYRVSNQEYARSVGPENLIGNMVLGRLNSLTELGSSGKSGSFFYYTHDCNYMIKTISPDEAELLRKLLPRYFQHMMNTENTLLSRIFGFHQLKIQRAKNEYQKIYLISIVNIFRAGLDMDFKYDVKGSLYGRQANEGSASTPLKDLDMIANKHFLSLEEADCQQLLKVIEQDCKFLSQSEIIDYSLLIGYHKRKKERLNQYGQYVSSYSTFYETFEGGLLSEDKEWIYYLGIIDILTLFNTKKQLEYGIKSTLISPDISCIPPVRYAERFRNFLTQNVLKPPSLKANK